MSKRFTITGGSALALILSVGAFSGFRSGVEAEGFPSSKAAVSINELVALSQAAAATDPLPDSGTTPWTTILQTQIKTSSQKDLVFDVALQCGILTDTTVRSSGGDKSSVTSRASIAVRVWVDDQLATPDNSIDANKAAADGVVYCDRIQTLEAKFAGLNCTADGETGVVTCTDPEELRLLLKSMNAHAFNFAKTDVGTGVHTVRVEARAHASVNFADDSVGGALGGAEAFAGVGSMLVEEVRLVKDANIIFE